MLRMQANMRHQASLMGIPDELFLKLVLKLVAGRKPSGTPAAGPSALYVSAGDVPSLWALWNTCKDIRETFARCLRHCQAHIAITYSPQLLKRDQWTLDTSNPFYPVDLWRTQWRHRCKLVSLATERYDFFSIMSGHTQLDASQCQLTAPSEAYVFVMNLLRSS